MSTETIALLSQPNAGKSTLFNGLTGSKQHVGNWPGKTVEKKEGTFSYNEKSYTIMDLPGSYSLYANSDEEVITRDYVASDESDLVCLLADASQLERSLFMLADYCGIDKPVMLVLNMMDVAEQKGIKIDTAKLSSKLGIPVVAMSATDKKQYHRFYHTLEKALKHPKKLSEKALDGIYKEEFGESYTALVDLVSKNEAPGFSPLWIASKLIEEDRSVESQIDSFSNSQEIKEAARAIAESDDGSLRLGSCKFRWIETVLADAVKRAHSNSSYTMARLDRIATSRRWGKPFALLVIFVGLILSFIPSAPFMVLGMNIIPAVLTPFFQTVLTAVSAPAWLIALVSQALVSALGFCTAMVGFVLGVSFVFGLIEEIGLMARVSYVFDNSMAKMGLQGKALMPMLVSLACNMAGASGARVIDTWGQKTLTIAMSWAIPCAASWSVFGLITGTFFGPQSALIVLLFLVLVVLHIRLTSRIFRKNLIPGRESAGLVMELPPYHKPRWGALFKFVAGRFFSVFWKAFKVVFLVCVGIWLLSYSSTGNIENSLIYRFGKWVEPVTIFFGLKWQLFVAWVCSIMGKESVMGVLSALFGCSSNGLYVTEAAAVATGATLSEAMRLAVTKPEALAFLGAFMFNPPCVITILATQTEIHSWKWTLKIVLYYIVSALAYAFILYHFGLLIWG